MVLLVLPVDSNHFANDFSGCISDLLGGGHRLGSINAAEAGSPECWGWRRSRTPGDPPQLRVHSRTHVADLVDHGLARDAELFGDVVDLVRLVPVDAVTVLPPSFVRIVAHRDLPGSAPSAEC